jgi:hypothetical protein
MKSILQYAAPCHYKRIFDDGEGMQGLSPFRTGKVSLFTMAELQRSYF